MNGWARLFVGAVSCLLISAAAGSDRKAVLLERPAIVSPLAAYTLMTSAAVAGRRFVMVGERGHILVEGNSGQWIQARVPVSVTLTNVFFVNERLGWAVGHAGIILHTQDGGITWEKQLDGYQIIAKLKASAEKNDALSDDARQWGTDGPDKPILGLVFLDERRGFAVGAYGLLLVTEDGGKNWDIGMDRLTNPQRRHLYSIRADASHLVIAGEQGSLFQSTDGGRHFRQMNSPYPGTYFDVTLLGDGVMFAAGLRGNLFRTQDGGKSWSRIELQSKQSLTQSLRLLDRSVALVDEAGVIWHSVDEGRTFTGNRPVGAFPFSGLAQAPDGTLLAVGARGALKLRLGGGNDKTPR